MWPFPPFVRVGEEYFTYRPRSDFLVLKFDLPRVAVEVDTLSQEKDKHHLMVQAVSMVRYANTLRAYKEKKSFIFVAIFISHKALAERYLLFQQGEEPQHVRTLKVVAILC